ncbi:hypothetical protein IX307_001371 [Bacteroides pyogenes]|uniref:hypothetical protein n=1 Tax=Bacteroides pyogenes TaxID=310300 RepID=UPI001BADC448|nr:hypothetical protein [Bacteroides pyogenes]MBR8720205.1 hypothetical protein [Bacteroides pyogenes]MBR8787050.1 hypothetical protein [Bacteroides pyogenes]MBR8792582.1 hypothetical protein [Bacteroides pyogenes]
MYKFDGVDIKTLGATPGKVPGECLAISGIFDMPKRIGETEHNWGSSIEPFVDKEDIEIDGRTITLVAIVAASHIVDFKKKAIACRVLGTAFGDFNVIQRDAIVVEKHADISIVTVKFWHPEYHTVPLSISPSGGSGMLIDNYNLISDFGIYMKYKSGVNDTAKRIDINTTARYSNSEYRELSDMIFTGHLKAASMQDAYSKMMQFHALCLSPGIRTFSDAGNKKHKVYFKDEIRCKAVMNGLLSFDLKMRRLND